MAKLESSVTESELFAMRLAIELMAAHVREIANSVEKIERIARAVTPKGEE